MWYILGSGQAFFHTAYEPKSFSLHRKSMIQGTSAAVHTFPDRQKPIPDGAGQYYVAGISLLNTVWL